MVTYRTTDGEMVDEICHRHYGRTRGVVEQVLEANPGLAARGPILPAGVRVELPEIEEGGNSKRVEVPWS